MTEEANILSSCSTGAEIAQQPAVWRAVAEIVKMHRAALDDFIAQALADTGSMVVLTGAGTSSFVGDLVAPELERRLARRVVSTPTTDIVAAPYLALPADRPVLLVSFARSGDSPESVAAVELADRLVPQVRHLVVTCNSEGLLATRLAERDDAFVLTLPPEANDTGFAMTSSFSGMTLAVLLAMGVDVDVEALAASGEAALAAAEDAVSPIVALRPRRLAYLASLPLSGLAHESSLKCLELTAGKIMTAADTSMGFRHGPKSMLDADTVVVVYLSNDEHTRAYDIDIARELSAELGRERVVVVDGAGKGSLPSTAWRVEGMAGTVDAVWALPAVVFAQTLALAASLDAGLSPDNPFPSGEVNRVVQGVVVHPLPDGTEA